MLTATCETWMHCKDIELTHGCLWEAYKKVRSWEMGIKENKDNSQQLVIVKRKTSGM